MTAERREFACFCCSYDLGEDHCKSCHAQHEAEKEAQAEHDAAIEARVRAELAEEIAVKIEAAKPSVKRFWDTADAARVCALNDAAKIARLAAGSSRDTTPAPCPTCQGAIRETVGLVCQRCGRDYGADTTPKLATGGVIPPGGAYIVGENGPEPIWPVPPRPHTTPEKR